MFSNDLKTKLSGALLDKFPDLLDQFFLELSREENQVERMQACQVFSEYQLKLFREHNDKIRELLGTPLGASSLVALKKLLEKVE